MTKSRLLLAWHVATEVSECLLKAPKLIAASCRTEVEARCGFKRAHLYKLMKEGKFPRPTRIGVRAVGWDSVAIEQWITDQLQRRT